MDDLVKRLRNARLYTGGGEMESALPDEAAARIEAQAAMLRECVEALECAGQVLWESRLSHMYVGGPLHEPFSEMAERRARTTLNRVKEMMK